MKEEGEIKEREKERNRRKERKTTSPGSSINPADGVSRVLDHICAWVL